MKVQVYEFMKESEFSSCKIIDKNGKDSKTYYSYIHLFEIKANFISKVKTKYQNSLMLRCTFKNIFDISETNLEASCHQ